MDEFVQIAPDIVAQANTDFPPEKVGELLKQLLAASGSERIQRCIVFAARGHPWRFQFLCKLAKEDFRDGIMNAEYDRHDTRLYDFTKPIFEAQIEDPHV
ncbi:MAG: hypothetical protein U1F81_08675 [Verrucomicrobiaceae bacterium]